MNILILSQYFPPETGAPQNRLHSLALHLAKLNCKVEILTAMPNYPKMEIHHDYKNTFYRLEKDGPLTIYRSWIFTKKSYNIIYRLLNYFSFVLSSILVGLFKIKRQDIILCESPPLFLGITGLILKLSKGAKLVFNVSDLWPESAEKLGIIKSKLLLKLSYNLESLLYRKSVLVTCQTQGIVKNIINRFPKVTTYWLPNGIDFKYHKTNSVINKLRARLNLSKNDFVLVYAGVMGYAQGLETVIVAAEALKAQSEIKFLLIGDGPEKTKLIKLAQNKELRNLVFLPHKPRNEVLRIISACDSYIVPLKKNELFMSAIPSKLFEPLAMGKPILLGVDGEARQLFIERGNCGLFFEPENAAELTQCINVLVNNKSLAKEMGEKGRQFVTEHFDRQNIAIEFYHELERLIVIKNP